MAVLGIAGSALYPQVQQVGGAINYVNNQSNGGSSPAGGQSFGAYNIGFNLGWELDFWGRFKRGIESANAAFFASVANQQDVQVLISAQAADLYFAYRTTEARIDIAGKNAKIQKRSFEITETNPSWICNRQKRNTWQPYRVYPSWRFRYSEFEIQWRHC